MRFNLFDAIFAALRRHPEGLTAQQLAQRIDGLRSNNLHIMLLRMVRAGVILHVRVRAPYMLPPIAYHPRTP